jgi:glycosyltransferase involved in cell wall biosynthesis
MLIANIGQICLRKGQICLARAAAHLAETFPEANYLLVGERHSQKAESVKYENDIRLIFRAAGIEDRLFCLGFRHDIPMILNEVDLVVHTANQEPLGRVLLEAASCGRPIVATKVGGTTEILSDRASALLVAPDDPEVLTDAIRLSLTDHELRTRLGQLARKQAVEKFSLSEATDRIFKFWKAFL